MCNKLSFNALVLDVPNSACSVDRARADHSWAVGVPVKTCDGGTVIRVNLLTLDENQVLTLRKILCSLYVFVSSWCSQILRYSAVVARMSFLVPSTSGIHITLVGGNSCLNSLIFLNPSWPFLSNPKSMISTWLFIESVL